MKLENRLRCLYISTDYVATVIAMMLYYIIRFHVEPNVGISTIDFLSLPTVLEGYILFPLAMIPIYYLTGFYNQVFIRSRVQVANATFTGALWGVVLFFLLAMIDNLTGSRRDSYLLLLFLFGLLFTIVYITRSIIAYLISSRVSSGSISFPTLIVGTDNFALDLYRRLKLLPPSRGLKVVGFVAMDKDVPTELSGVPVYSFEQLDEICRDLRIDKLALSLGDKGDKGDKYVASIISKLIQHDKPILVEANYAGILGRAVVSDILAEPLTDITMPNISEATRSIKRVVDVLVGSVGLLITSPIILLSGLAVKLNSPGPMFYKQTRIGFHRKPFTLYKIRSMIKDAEKDGIPRLAREDDPRITPVGAILRKYRIDELPQLWNVIKGDMSLIGPRPEREHFVKELTRRVPAYALLHRVRPGLTSWGMVKYGYAEDIEGMLRRMRYDFLYLDNITLSIDLKILLHTIRIVLKGAGK